MAPGTGVSEEVSVAVDESNVVAVVNGPDAWRGAFDAPRSIWNTPMNNTTNPTASTTARRAMGRRKLGVLLRGAGDPGKDEDGSITHSSG